MIVTINSIKHNCRIVSSAEDYDIVFCETLKAKKPKSCRIKHNDLEEGARYKLEYLPLNTIWLRRTFLQLNKVK